jgi:hypothetical protein
MNGKKIACLVLMMILGMIMFGTQMMTKRAAARIAETEAVETDKRTAESDCEVARNTTLRLKDETQELRQFLGTWTPIINGIQSSQDAEQALLTHVRNSGILVVSQKLEMKENRGNMFAPKLFQGTLTVQDEYAKTMNWLGDLEVKIPLMRITSCRIKQGETGRQMNLEIHFELPVINLLAELDATK